MSRDSRQKRLKKASINDFTGVTNNLAFEFDTIKEDFTELVIPQSRRDSYLGIEPSQQKTDLVAVQRKFHSFKNTLSREHYLKYRKEIGETTENLCEDNQSEQKQFIIKPMHTKL